MPSCRLTSSTSSFIFIEALRRFATEALTNSSKCRVENDGGSEDVEMGHCLKNVGVRNEDSRDNLGRYRFLPFNPEAHLRQKMWPDSGFWYWKNIKYEHHEVASHFSSPYIL